VLIPDVNILVGALRADHPDHGPLRDWLVLAAGGPEPLGLTDAVLAGFVRVVTHPKVFAEPTSINRALSQIDGLLAAPAAVRIHPDGKHWELFSDLCRGAQARGNLIADAHHAATAMQQGATWVSQDRDFARFPGLRWVTAL
jgi:hypothetical protein